MIYSISHVPWTQTMLLSAMSGGLVEPIDLLIWFSPVLLGFTFAIWIAAITSRTFDGVAARRLFAIPEEIETPPVVRAVLHWEARFRGLLPDVTAPDAVIADALRDPRFYVLHRRETRARPQVAEALLGKIDAVEKLSRDELMAALSERRCFDELHTAAVAGRERR